jgi:hypothetical protein
MKNLICFIETLVVPQKLAKAPIKITNFKTLTVVEDPVSG